MRASLLAAAILVCGACAGSTDVAVPTTAKVYTGTYSVQVVESTVSTSLLGGGTFPCTNTYTMSGTLTMTIDEPAGGMTGSAEVAGTQTETAHSNGDSCKAKGNLTTGWNPKLTGTTSDLHFADQSVVPNGSYVVTTRTAFAGALSGGVVTGSLTFSVSGVGTIGTSAITQSYSATTGVTLR